MEGLGSCNASGHQVHEPAGIRVMRLDQMLGQSHSVASASSCMSIRTSLEEGIKPHRFAGIFPEQFLTEAGRHREAVVAADQRMVIRCFGDDLGRLRPRCILCDASNPMRSIDFPRPVRSKLSHRSGSIELTATGGSRPELCPDHHAGRTAL